MSRHFRKPQGFVMDITIHDEMCFAYHDKSWCIGCKTVVPGQSTNYFGYHYDCEPCKICLGTIKGCSVNTFIPDSYLRVHYKCSLKMVQILIIQRWMRVYLEKLRLFNEHYDPDNFFNTVQGRRVLKNASLLKDD